MEGVHHGDKASIDVTLHDDHRVMLRSIDGYTWYADRQEYPTPLRTRRGRNIAARRADFQPASHT